MHGTVCAVDKPELLLAFGVDRGARKQGGKNKQPDLSFCAENDEMGDWD